eukprot:15132452-Alexandrium_andersonii.AAC.1
MECTSKGASRALDRPAGTRLPERATGRQASKTQKQWQEGNRRQHNKQIATIKDKSREEKRLT